MNFLFTFTIFTLLLFISCSDNKSKEVKYQDLTWYYKAEDKSNFDVLIKDSLLHIQFYKKDTFTKELIKTDSVNARILQWDNGYIIIENNNNYINDTIIYEVNNSTGTNSLFLKLISYHYYTPQIQLAHNNIIPLKTESQVIVNSTNYWKTYPDDIEGLKCGDSIAWDDLEYFGLWDVEYRLRKNQSIIIYPTGGRIHSITREDIPISEVDSMVNSITEKLSFKPKEIRFGYDLPSYEWEKGLLKVCMGQEIDINNGTKKQSYNLIIDDGEAQALIYLNRKNTDPDGFMSFTKGTVRQILQRAVENGKVDVAMRIIDSAISIDPTCYLAYYIKADIKSKSGNINGAKFDCIKAYNLNPYYQPALELLLITYLYENDNVNAKQLVKQKEALINKTPRSAQILGYYYRMIENDKNTACKYYNLAFDRGYSNAMKDIREFCNH